jgi:hypothetical protein
VKRAQLRHLLDRIGPRPDTGDFIDLAHQRVFGTPAGFATRRRYAGLLARGDRLGILTAMLRDPRHVEDLAAEMAAPGLSDHEFLEAAYRRLLDRDPDDVGLRSFLAVLTTGSTRADVVAGMVRSQEYQERALRRYFPLVDLCRLRPDRYGKVESTPVFRAEGPEDFDWLESAILEGGYYDKPGVWNFGIDTDKRLMAEVVSALGPRRVLELGCASGPVLQCLHDLGIEAHGVEISQAAIDAAFPDVAGRIHQVNATSFELPSTYDVIFGLDIFEHLNPNHLGECLARIEAHLNPGGFLFCNIPAFGDDPVFGEVFPIYMEPWWADLEEGTHFRTLHVDDLGYPVHGHLIWAHTRWWVQRFCDLGLHREVGIEQALHGRYDTYLERAAPARKSFYIFSKNAAPADVERIRGAIFSSGSAVLAAL